MSFFTLVRREMQGSPLRLGVMSSLGGVSSALLLAAINAGAQAASSGKVGVWAAALFLVSLLLYIKSQQFILIVTAAEIQAIIHKIRVRLMDRVRHSELLPLESIGRARVVAAVTKDTEILAQASNTLAFTGQSVILVAFVAAYVGYLSFKALVLSILIVGFSAFVFHLKSGALAKGHQEAASWENRLFDRLTSLLDGFKEVRLNRARSKELFNDIEDVSRKAANIKINAQAEDFKRMIFSQSTLYILLAAVVFVLPSIGSGSGAAITKTTTALLFVVGACFGLVQSIPTITAANAAADEIERLDARLRDTATAADLDGAPLPQRFDRIEMRNVAFRYVDQFSNATFQVGPLDFTLKRGELVFITGGNGSGKSTFLRLLAGLYLPESGEISFDGRRVDHDTRDEYRALLSAVFTDYYLFQRLYGIPDPEPQEVDRMIAEFWLERKTALREGEFDTVNLSAGQRKRLALIVSLLEKRPILLLDEWAAEQDPDFRRRFYRELLPALHRMGVTLVVITHDDLYIEHLEVPARRLRMEEGRFLAENAGESDQ